ncbi:LIM zinc-binding domain-containing Nebulette-like [Hippocampus zosterae]|uniref:LIM zinc-binding domain-containing Nebulette-like n=1 Tax=Hippocampus zosterae TaxID=109293 RepID=UPI00223DBF52|nr:LIM zinc-binding domain-containing Nebulette-like [Hippocampus zosterae]
MLCLSDCTRAALVIHSVPDHKAGKQLPLGAAHPCSSILFPGDIITSLRTPTLDPLPVARMNPQCARCGKVVYPTEKVSCLDKNWHKGCFHCEVCKMTLNMKNYKGYDKKPYCNAHYPKTSFTTVADTPENLRLRQQSQLQSQVRKISYRNIKMNDEHNLECRNIS